MEPLEQYAPEPNRLERYAADYLRRENGREAPELRARAQTELEELRGVQRRAVAWACVAGAISGGILGAAELAVRRWYLEDPEALDWREQLPHWAGFLGLALVVSGIEILFLYWNALRAAARVSRIAGLALGGGATGELMTRGIARAALEFPNPREALYGIDPYVRIPRWRLWGQTVLYRMKVGVSSFLLRVLLRRILGRAALRFFIPLLAGPLYAVWNGIITWRILRETRLRAFAPFAVQELAAQIAADRNELGEEGRRLILTAVGEVLIRSADAHPNFVLLLSRLFEALEMSPDDVHVDWAAQRAGVARLNAKEQAAVLKAIVLAGILDGRVSGAEMQLLGEVHDACGRPLQRGAVDRLYRRFLHGQALRREDFDAVGPARAGE
jgi:hypothetical protein